MPAAAGGANLVAVAEHLVVRAVAIVVADAFAVVFVAGQTLAYAWVTGMSAAAAGADLVAVAEHLVVGAVAVVIADTGVVLFVAG